MSDKRRPLELSLDQAEKAVGDSMLLAPFLLCPFPPLARAGDPQATGEERATRRQLNPEGTFMWESAGEDALLPSFQGGLSSLNPFSQRLPCMEHELR